MIGKHIGPWQLSALLGSGAMGRVYRAEDEAGRRVAIKVLHPQLTPHDEARARFVREARLGTGLRDPRIVKTVDLGRTTELGSELVYLVMEYVEGQTLRALIKQDGALPERLVRHIGLEIASALATIHGAGVLHRDLKPENVLISEEHIVKVMDLGLARLQDDIAGLSRTGQFLGTLLYASPEQLEGQRDLDGRADLYALGVMLYELTTGKNPFDADSVAGALERQLTHTPPPLGEVVPGISAWLSDLVESLLQKRASARPQEAEDVVEALGAGPLSAWWRAYRESREEAARATPSYLPVDESALFVGREDRLARLDGFLDQHARDPHFLGARVLGAPGSGVSRVLAAWTASVATRHPEARLVVHACEAHESPFRALLHAAVRALHHHDAAPPLAALTDLPAPLAAALGEMSTAPSLRSSAPALLEPDRVERVVLTLLNRMAAAHPTVVVLDQVHALTPEGARAATRLRSALAHAPLVWVEGDHESASEPEGLTAVPVGPLPEADVRTLVEHLLGEGGAADEILRRLSEGGVGNPALILNWIRTLKRDKVLTQGDRGTWRFEAGSTDVASALPETLRAAVEQRLERLAPEEAQLLGTCAVVGAQFDPSDVIAILDAPPLDVLRKLSRVAHQHGLLRSEGDVFAFRPAWVAELAYHLIPEAQRARIHQQVAERLATQRPGDAVARCHHNLHGGRPVEANVHVPAAVAALRREGNHAGALELCREVTAALLQIEAREPTAHVDLLTTAAEIEVHLGRSQQALVTLAEAREACAEDPRRRAAILNRMGTAHYILGELDESRLALHEAHLLAIQLGDAHALIEAKIRLGILETREDELITAKRHLAVACQIARDRGMESLEGNAQMRLATVYIRRSELDHAEACLVRALALAEAQGLTRLQVTTRANLAWFDLIRGAYDAAREKVHTSVALAREHGFAVGVMQGEGNLAHLELRVGRFDVAAEHIAREATRVAEVDPGPGTLHLMQHEADLALLTGNLIRARELLEGALERAKRWHYVEHVGTALLQLGQLAYEQNKPEDALTHYDEALAILEEAGAHIEVLPLLLNQASVHAELGHDAMAIATATRVLEAAEPLGYVGPASVAKALLARLGQADPEAVLIDLHRVESHLGFAEYLEALGHLMTVAPAEGLVALGRTRLDEAARTLPEDEHERFLSVPRRHAPFRLAGD